MNRAQPERIFGGFIGRGTTSLGVEIREQRDFGKEGLGGVKLDREVDQPVEVFGAELVVVEILDHVLVIEGLVEPEDDFAGIVLQVFLAVGDEYILHLFPLVACGSGQGRDQFLVRFGALEVYAAVKPAENLLRRLGPHLREQLQQAGKGQLVGGVHQQAQNRADILDVRLFEETDPGSDDVGHLRAGQLHLQLHGMKVRPVEHADFGIRDAPPMKLLCAFDHIARLDRTVTHLDQMGKVIAFPDGLKLLLELLRIAGDHLVGDIQDFRRAAVVDLQLEGLCVGIGAVEIKKVAEVRAAPGINALEVVAHHHEVAVGLDEHVHQFCLDGIGILVFVDQHILEFLLVKSTDALVFGEQPVRMEEQVVEIHGIGFALSLLISGVHLEHLIDINLREFKPFRCGGGEIAHAPANDTEQAEQHIRLRKVFFLHTDLLGAGANQLLGVVGIENSVVLAEAQYIGVRTQQTVGEGVEGAAVAAVEASLDQCFGARQHFPGGLVGKGQQQDLPRLNVFLGDQPGEAVDQRARLARSGGGHHQRGAVGRADGSQLFFVEFFVEIH